MLMRRCSWLLAGYVDLRSAWRVARRPCSHVAQAQLTFLIDKLGLPTRQAEEFVDRHKTITEVSTEHLSSAVEMLLVLGFNKSQIQQSPDVILLKAVTIKQRTMLLQEAGVVKVTPHYLSGYLLLAKKNVSVLKASGLIPGEVDVAQSMLSYLEEYKELGPLRSPGDNVSLTDTQVAVVSHYLCWRLDMTAVEVARLIKTYTRIKNKSVRLISLTLDILEHQLGFSRDKIKSNGYLIHSHPDNTLRTLREVSHIRGIAFKDIVRLHPKIVMSPTDTLLCTLRYLEEYGIVDKAVWRNPQVLTLGSDSVRARLEEIRSVPGLNGLQKHPRILRLVQYLHKARARLSKLQELRVRCASLHVLCGTQARFERYLRDGLDRTRGRDMVHYLSSVLGHDGKEIRALLRKHPYWCHVPLQAVKLTCDCLLQHGYSTDQVFNNVYLLLYPRVQVQAELQRLRERPELRSEVFLAARDNADQPRAHDLALCLYFIERDYHFTGDGVWQGLPAVESAVADTLT